MVEEVFGVVGELAFRVEREAAAEGIGRAFEERRGVDIAARPGAAAGLVGGELRAPAQRVPEAGVVRAQFDGALYERQALTEAVLPGDQHGAGVLQRFDVRGVELQRPPCQRQSAGDIARGVAFARQPEQLP